MKKLVYLKMPSTTRFAMMATVITACRREAMYKPAASQLNKIEMTIKGTKRTSQ